MEKENILETIKDKKFLNEIINLTDIEDVKKAFKSKGIDITDKDIEEMRQGAAKYINDVEISEEFLDNIVGGVGENNQQPIIINNYINNDNTNINKVSSQSNNNVNFKSSSNSNSSDNSRPATNAEVLLFGSIFTIAGAAIMGFSIKGGIQKGWLSNF